MPVTLIVETENPANAGVHVLRGVDRIGSDAAMDVCLEGVEPHALTVQSRDGSSHVFNRTARPLQVDRAKLPPGESLLWREGHCLRLGSDLKLRLEVVETLPAATPPTGADPSAEEEYADETAGASEGGKKRPQHSTLLVCGFLLLFGGYLFLGSSGSPAASTDARFTSLIDDLIAAPQDARLHRIRQSLQIAYGYETRGDRSSSVDEYSVTRRLLLQPRRQSDPLAGIRDVRETEERALAFVRERLGWLD